MRVVIVDGDVSYPPTSGKRLRTLNLMIPLARRHKITYLARSQQAADDTGEAETFLRDHGIEPCLVNDPLPRKSGPLFYARLGLNLASSLPYSVASHRSASMRRAACELASQQPVDLWQCEWTGYLNALQDQPQRRRLLIAHNVDTLIWERYLSVESRTWRRWFLRQQCEKFAQFERHAFHQAGRVVAVSEPDAARIRADFDFPDVDVVDNGIDADWLEAVRSERGSGPLLFLGALDWRPNQDAVQWFLTDILPRVRVTHPDVRLSVVGRRPPRWLEDLIERTVGAELHADVPDVRPYLTQSALMVVPLRIGGGSRLKVLESLAAGLPVISTTVGAEGLRLVPDQHYDVADTVDQWISSITQNLADPEPAYERAEAGRQLVQQHYDWSALAARLEEIWERQVAAPRDCCELDHHLDATPRTTT